jgi:peptide/nickel transport system substrate-binding protein
MTRAIRTAIAATAALLVGGTELSAQQILTGPLAKLDITQPEIVKGGQSKGTLTIGWHTGFTPKWLDPQQQPIEGGTTTAILYFVHDALIRNMPQGKLTLSLAEHAEMSADLKKAAFRLRPNLTFHDGTPVTAAEVKWSYENYRGVRSDIIKQRTERVEIAGDRTIIFHFKEAFPDFMYWYSGGENGIGFVVPSKYYQAVGEDGFIAKPVGAGPFRLVDQKPGTEMTFEAFRSYWRRAPGVEKIVVKVVGAAGSRVAGLKTGELDLAFEFSGNALKALQDDSRIRWTANNTSAYWIGFPQLRDPKSPFHDKRVREAVSLAINRDLISQQQTDGLAYPTGSWVGQAYPDEPKVPVPEFNPNKARALLADAGHANGLDVTLSPFPPGFNIGESVATNLQRVGIRAKLQRLDTPKFLGSRARNAWEGVDMYLSIDMPPSLSSQMIERYGLCDARSSAICIESIEQLWKKYNASVDLRERYETSREIQHHILREYMVVPVVVGAFVHAIGPRVLPEGNASAGQGFHKYWDTVANPYPIPWEDWRVKEKVGSPATADRPLAASQNRFAGTGRA